MEPISTQEEFNEQITNVFVQNYIPYTVIDSSAFRSVILRKYSTTGLSHPVGWKWKESQ